MKSAAFGAACFLTALELQAQGTLNFATGAPDVNAPATVYYWGPGPGLPPFAPAGPEHLAQLFIGQAGTTDASLLTTNGVNGGPVAFGTGAAAGYVIGGARTISGYPAGTTITVQVRAWYAGLGHTSWNAAPAALRTASGVGSPNLIQVTLRTAPTPPPNLVGLQPYIFGTLAPEPGAWALLAAGAAAFAFRFRRRP